MITSIFSGTPYLQTTTPTMPYVGSAPNAGQLRYNTQTNSIEVSNGTSWMPIGGSSTITASVEFTQIMDWAKAEMQKSQRITALAAQSTAVADALAAYELAAEKLKVVVTLSDKETK